MTNIEIYKNVFIDVFGVEENALNENFTANNVAEWDSMRKLNLLTALEDEFEIMFDTSDMLGFSSFEEGKKILAKYGVII